MYDKIIVTNREGLITKYGNIGFENICKAVTLLEQADEKRGIKDSIVYLDDKAEMKRLRSKPVTRTTDSRQNKKAIDDVFKFHNPHYLMILGSPDILPHQDLTNPTQYRGDDIPSDDDDYAWGDLPYACDAPYSRDPARFVGPTRVIGRSARLGGRQRTFLSYFFAENSRGLQDASTGRLHERPRTFCRDMAGLDSA